MNRWHKWPHMHESVIDSERDDRGPYGRGSIIHVDKLFNQVLVRFFAPPEAHHARWVLVYGDDILWQADESLDCSQPQYIDLNASTEAATVDQLMRIQYFDFDDLKWSSHVGGVGAWVTRGYHP
jgi:hypothetical protein